MSESGSATPDADFWKEMEAKVEAKWERKYHEVLETVELKLQRKRVSQSEEISRLNAELNELQEGKKRREFYDSAYTSPYICGASLIKAIEEDVWDIGGNVIKEISKQLTGAERKDFNNKFFTVDKVSNQKAESYSKFLGIIDTLGKNLKNTILCEIETRFLEEYDPDNQFRHNFQLRRSFDEFYTFWRVRNMKSVHLFDWVVDKHESPDDREQRIKLQAEVLIDLEKNHGSMNVFNPFKHLLLMGVKKKIKLIKNEYGDVVEDLFQHHNQ